MSAWPVSSSSAPGVSALGGVLRVLGVLGALGVLRVLRVLGALGVLAAVCCVCGRSHGRLHRHHAFHLGLGVGSSCCLSGTVRGGGMATILIYRKYFGTGLYREFYVDNNCTVVFPIFFLTKLLPEFLIGHNCLLFTIVAHLQKSQQHRTSQLHARAAKTTQARHQSDGEG
jgi:hypothetical protein